MPDPGKKETSPFTNPNPHDPLDEGEIKFVEGLIPKPLLPSTLRNPNNNHPSLDQKKDESRRLATETAELLAKIFLEPDKEDDQKKKEIVYRYSIRVTNNSNVHTLQYLDQETRRFVVLTLPLNIIDLFSEKQYLDGILISLPMIKGIVRALIRRNSQGKLEAELIDLDQIILADRTQIGSLRELMKAVTDQENSVNLTF